MSHVQAPLSEAQRREYDRQMQLASIPANALDVERIETQLRRIERLLTDVARKLDA